MTDHAPTASSSSHTGNGQQQSNRESLYSQLRWSSHHTPITRRRKLELLRSYLPDWIITILLAGLLAIINNVHGFRREFSLTDTSIQHTYAVHERVPTWLLGVLAVLIPAIIIVGFSLGVSNSVWDLHNGLLGFVLAQALTVTVTTIIKCTVGRPRPDLIDRCQPAPGSVNASPYGLVTDIICTVGVDNKILRDGFRSFPSGHASTSFAGFTYLSLYLAGKLHLFDRRGHAVTAWLCGTPLMAATLIAVSRTMDYRHHATDVIAGGLLGLVVAYWSYKLYYPPLGHAQSHKPYSPRIPNERMMGAGEEGYAPTQGEEREGLRPFRVQSGREDEGNPYKPHGHNGLDTSIEYPDRETVPRV
ncbi:Phosphatidic acid phosphatase type 2/haloperoxidase [Kalmanozyma brasiliensis GHG001]|uniref:Phosphatidic acid phosphatase type 2/haloperoxidase domain-containing protein n=1 Tax=Kalmanozyma brasiliensis (strain GHG001) TaxID=1365824 RepID=V5EUA4_KALBG|nr:Phosphatidic acid phosphatase type 2/haloperoxidase [Kalmanozyma brasiliensis GHG001]EST08955.1 Phosphatidic acid phosphatase type 2/haloperoxidase [Kalmanozyma brasiliensis GHG001]